MPGGSLHRTLALPAALALLGGCLPDEGPLFEPVPTDVSAAADEPPAEPAPAPLRDGVSTQAEQVATPSLRAPAAPALPVPAATPEPPEETAPAAASAMQMPGLCEAEGVLACETFEEQPPGAFPSGTAWLPELSGCGTHVVDDGGPAASGTHALRADAGGYPECMLHADVSGESELFVRTRVFLEAGAAPRSPYVSLLELGVGETRDDPELRLGLRPAGGGPCSDAPGLDLTGSGLLGGTATECAGVPLEPGRWHCLELGLSRAGRSASVTVSVDGSAVLASDVVGGPAWDDPALFVKLGRAAYGESGEGAVWHDDVVISRVRVPCEGEP